MKSILTALLAAGASADITTSFGLPYMAVLGTDRITYVASVLGANKDRMTLVAQRMPGPDYDAAGLSGGNATHTMTLASTFYEHSEDISTAGLTGTPGAWANSVRCEIPTADASATCTGSVGASIARLGVCREPDPNNKPTTVTREWTITRSGTQEVATVIRTFPGGPTTPPPDWCSADDPAAVPSSLLTMDAKLDQSKITTFTFIITAGEEKLPSATTGGTPNDSTAEPTGTEAPEGTGATGGETGAAMPLKTLAPALAGLGAAVAAFL